MARTRRQSSESRHGPGRRRDRAHRAAAARRDLDAAAGGARRRAARGLASSGGGALHRLHGGVYAVGHPLLTGKGRWMAAVLTCGDGAALFHASAAALWDIRRSDAAWIDIVVPTGAGRAKRAGIRLHRIRTLRSDEAVTHDGIRVTTPARTLLDVAATLSRDRLERALDRAEILELTDYPALDAMARAHPNHHGVKPLRAALSTYMAGTRTRSDLENLFVALCRRHGLPRPLVNHDLNGKEVDFLFAEQRLIVEIDSWRYHKTRRAFDADRARDALHLTLGYRTLCFTDRQLTNDEHRVAATLRTALAKARAA